MRYQQPTRVPRNAHAAPATRLDTTNAPPYAPRHQDDLRVVLPRISSLDGLASLMIAGVATTALSCSFAATVPCQSAQIHKSPGAAVRSPAAATTDCIPGTLLVAVLVTQ